MLNYETTICADRWSFPSELVISAGTDRNEIMDVRGNKTLLLVEVQFHPELILMPFGDRLIKNFIEQNFK
jgi:anthranilate/para-aminobenzoate synthase component II